MGRLRLISWLGVMAGLSVVLGALAALLWARVVHLPGYVVGDDHTAVMSEHGHAEVFAADAWFVVIGLVVGLVLGGLAWSWFRSVGWPVALISAGAALLSGLVCWGIGQLLGPGSFEERLAHAAPGDTIPVAFQLHAPVALAAWAATAVLPAMLASLLGPELPGAGREPGAPVPLEASAEPQAEPTPV